MDFEIIFALILAVVSTAYIIVMGILICGFLRFRQVRTISFHERFGQKLPSVSVIIPVRNESMNIRNCLDDMLYQDYPQELMEILVTDDFSEDHSISFVQLFIQQHTGFPVSVIPSKGDQFSESGKKRALSRAIHSAKGELIITTDADTRRGHAWISAIVKAYTNGRFQMILGPVAIHHEKNLLLKIQSLELMGLIGTTAAATFLQVPFMCNGANLSYQRTAFFETGGFEGNTQFASGDDMFMMAGVRKRFGANTIGFVLDQDAIVFTEGESSLGGFINQRLRWVSKSRGYKETGVISMAVLTWLTHFLLLTGMLIGLFHPVILIVSFGLWIIKILADYPIVRIMACFFGKKNLLGYYFIAQMFQLIYIVFIGISGNLFSYSWKGRKMASAKSKSTG